ncbi:hypothetical protein [Nocardia sp. NPDC050435]|uniref:hypothetical protein n=1 Tax=Nocardia sp. NPDC050435 TaxID=3155040 RepID=UPI0033C5CE18
MIVFFYLTVGVLLALCFGVVIVANPGTEEITGTRMAAIVAMAVGLVVAWPLLMVLGVVLFARGELAKAGK